MWSAAVLLATCVVVAVVAVVAEDAAGTQPEGVCPRIVPRDEWGARLPKLVTEMQNPVTTVVIHHTASPAYCATTADCIAAMQSMQVYHQDGNGWDDIGYSFAVGGDGRVYKGRGWNRIGAHAPPYNADSIGITLIGDWSNEAPPKVMLDAVEWLIRCGVDTGRIAPNYQLVGHRQVRHTECPGNGLFAVIQTWDHWVQDPAPPARRPGLEHHHHAEAAAVAPLLVVPETPEPQTPAAAAGLYDPSTPDAEQAVEVVEVRPLNKRSLWDRLVTIWEKEAMRQAAIARREELAALQQQDAS
ncbi:peptidoglycan-recognition protein LB-like isoform X2 [Thrips palmi]|uniref:Peptidoglycan-recognition protein LB-like isoform X2 n=1 Tax=Thrips palmi TaxID=161013 RepID=A0A6P8ZKE5_THRPL|nr:peptidoglycan-recognition protein LB-like isoform X2 [Thrips palmi]